MILTVLSLIVCITLVIGVLLLGLEAHGKTPAQTQFWAALVYELKTNPDAWVAVGFIATVVTISVVTTVLVVG